jgi:hypothetical protein
LASLPETKMRYWQMSDRSLAEYRADPLARGFDSGVVHGRTPSIHWREPASRSLVALAEHASFFVREAAARLIASYPNAQLVAVAESLANDRHAQVARPGKTALSAVKRVAWSS